MSTYVGSAEAATILGVTPATLYAYVSRGRIERTAAPDGRSSLFARAEVESLAERGRHAPPGPRPTIDVRIASNITHLDESGVTIRGRSLPDVVRAHSFEDVAELLWSSELPECPVVWPASERDDREALKLTHHATPNPIGRLAIAAHQLDARHPGAGAADAARRLLINAPEVLGSKRRTGAFAERLTCAWVRRPSTELVAAIDNSLGVLADHELATSTLAVRVAASARTTPFGAYASGLATVDGTLHGSASNEVHAFLTRCVATSAVDEIGDLRRRRELIPGFGHKVYRGPDPRFQVVLESVRRVAHSLDRMAEMDILDDVISEVCRIIPKYPNVDLALGALTWVAGLPADAPIFAVARIAGWGAHFAEELDAPPLRFRGVAS